MTQVFTVSATTAAYAAEAIRPSARVRGDGPTDEATTLAKLNNREKAPGFQLLSPPVRCAPHMAFSLLKRDTYLPQRTRREAQRLYEEFESSI